MPEEPTYKPDPTLHQIIYALSNALSNILLVVDAGDFDYDDRAEITIENHQLKVQKGSTTIHDSRIN